MKRYAAEIYTKDDKLQYKWAGHVHNLPVLAYFVSDEVASLFCWLISDFLAMELNAGPHYSIVAPTFMDTQADKAVDVALNELHTIGVVVQWGSSDQRMFTNMQDLYEYYTKSLRAFHEVATIHDVN